MKSDKNHPNRVYLVITAAALVLAAILLVSYGISWRTQEQEAARTVTTKTEKEKKDSGFPPHPGLPGERQLLPGHQRRRAPGGWHR